jgi:hypothetical protein
MPDQKPQVAQAVENPRAFIRPNEFALQPGEVSANYIIARLKRATEPLVIRAQMGNRSKAEIKQLFANIVDGLNADLWMGRNILYIDDNIYRITFHNRCILFFS